MSAANTTGIFAQRVVSIGPNGTPLPRVSAVKASEQNKPQAWGGHSGETGNENPSGTERVRVAAIVGRPHPASQGEQLLAAEIQRDPMLARLFEFNQPVETTRRTRYLVDLLWAAGRVIVEVDDTTGTPRQRLSTTIGIGITNCNSAVILCCDSPTTGASRIPHAPASRSSISSNCVKTPLPLSKGESVDMELKGMQRLLLWELAVSRETRFLKDLNLSLSATDRKALAREGLTREEQQVHPLSGRKAPRRIHRPTHPTNRLADHHQSYRRRSGRSAWS